MTSDGSINYLVSGSNVANRVDNTIALLIYLASKRGVTLMSMVILKKNWSFLSNESTISCENKQKKQKYSTLRAFCSKDAAVSTELNLYIEYMLPEQKQLPEETDPNALATGCQITNNE